MGWVVMIVVAALVVGASAGTVFAAVLIAAGRAQQQERDGACPSCSQERDPVPASGAGQAPADLREP